MVELIEGGEGAANNLMSVILTGGSSSWQLACLRAEVKDQEKVFAAPFLLHLRQDLKLQTTRPHWSRVQ